MKPILLDLSKQIAVDEKRMTDALDPFVRPVGEDEYTPRILKDLYELPKNFLMPLLRSHKLLQTVM